MSATDHPGDRLSAYVDGELPAGERAAIDAHLRECSACSRLLDEMIAVDAAALALTVQAPEGYFDAFPARVRGRLAARRSRRVPAWTWAAAAAVLLGVLTPLTLRDRRAPAPASASVPASVPAAEPAPARRMQEPAAPDAAPANRPPAASVRSFGYVAGGPAPSPAPKEREMRQQPPPQDDRLRERDQARAAGGERAAELKKEAAVADKAGADAPRANAATGRADEQRPSEMFSRTERDAAPAAPPPPAAQAQVAKPKPVEEGTLSVGKLAAPPAKRAAAPAATAPGTAESADARRDASLAFADEFESLASRPLRTAAEARAAAREWGAFAARHPQARAADEARVRAIEALATAWRLERKPADRELARRLARAYLAGDGPQAARVRALVVQLDS